MLTANDVKANRALAAIDILSEYVADFGPDLEAVNQAVPFQARQSMLGLNILRALILAFDYGRQPVPPGD